MSKYNKLLSENQAVTKELKELILNHEYEKKTVIESKNRYIEELQNQLQELDRANQLTGNQLEKLRKNYSEDILKKERQINIMTDQVKQSNFE